MTALGCSPFSEQPDRLSACCCCAARGPAPNRTTPGRRGLKEPVWTRAGALRDGHEDFQPFQANPTPGFRDYFPPLEGGKSSAFRSTAPKARRLPLPLAKTYLNATVTGENIPQNRIWRLDWTLLSVSSLYVVMALWHKDRNLLEKPNNLLMIFPEEITSYLIGRV